MTARVPPQRVPTLTEVIELSRVGDLGAPVEAPPAAPPPTADELTTRVLADVQRQVELMLEHRLREALMPALLRATDTLVLDARTELATALHELVARAVEQALARQREP